MTTGAADQTETAAEGWRAIRADDSIQFAPVAPPEQAEQPQWLRDFFEWLAGVLEPLGRLFGGSWPVIKWILLALAVAGALAVLWRLIEPLMARTPQGNAEETPWLPQRGNALALL